MTASSTSSGSSRFWAWLQRIAPYPKALAWCHVTDSYGLRAIIESGSLLAQRCPVFGEDLVYFSYGRPAYRYKDQSSLRISARAPVVIVLSPDLVMRGKRIFPFDTGAFADKRYTAWMHRNMQLANFEVACPSDGPQRHVSSFFRTNSGYLALAAHKPNEDYAGEFEVDSLVALLSDPDVNSADDRRIAVELQVDHPIPFRHPEVQGIIVPDQLMHAPYFRHYRSGSGKDMAIGSYVLTPQRRASDYQALLEERTEDLQAEWGLV